MTIPPRSLFEHSAGPVFTNSAGEFTSTINRTSAPTTVPVPDTVSVYVEVKLIKQAYRAASGESPIKRDTVLVTFVPKNNTPAPIAVECKFAPPL